MTTQGHHRDLKTSSIMKHNYDKHLPHRFSGHARKINIGQLKAERLRVKNERRAKHGLPPKAYYSEI